MGRRVPKLAALAVGYQTAVLTSARKQLSSGTTWPRAPGGIPTSTSSRTGTSSRRRSAARYDAVGGPYMYQYSTVQLVVEYPGAIGGIVLDGRDPTGYLASYE